MTGGWIVLALLVIFFLWADWLLRKRNHASGPDAMTDRHRRTGGYGSGNG